MAREKIASVIQLAGEEILKLVDKIDYDVAAKLEERILQHPEKSIFFTGCGTSGKGAQKIVHTFRVVNLPASYIDPSDAVHGGLGVVREGDMLVIISKGGNTKELTSFLDNLAAKKVFIVAVTENEDSAIAKAADLIFKITVDRESDVFNMIASASTLAVMAVFDAIAVDLMKDMGFTKEELLINHPSGLVGDRLQEERG
ncbi:SIS domain-containing protein [Selenomonas sp. TAMA-11512]|uniref:SIS domain-containing protein n=1 Tax=Selenomonas sp. TAMA-11512 TaxID=3095337 RepID=UPI003091D372|nr:SIS domain-containing protein [Selenomonas sp. TAMA-11512]